MQKTFDRLAVDWSVSIEERRADATPRTSPRYIPTPEEIASTIVVLASPRAA